MSRKYSKAQNLYMLAKANLETLEAEEKSLEHKYIIDNGIKNPDGSIPDLIYCIEDEQIFNQVNEAFGKITEDSGLWTEILEARELLKQAEENLINWGLTIVKKDLPKATLETLIRGMKHQYKIRLEMIELTLKLQI
jgi:hypothetical protein